MRDGEFRITHLKRSAQTDATQPESRCEKWPLQMSGDLLPTHVSRKTMTYADRMGSRLRGEAQAIDLLQGRRAITGQHRDVTDHLVVAEQCGFNGGLGLWIELDRRLRFEPTLVIAAVFFLRLLHTPSMNANFVFARRGKLEIKIVLRLGDQFPAAIARVTRLLGELEEDPFRELVVRQLLGFTQQHGREPLGGVEVLLHPQGRNTEHVADVVEAVTDVVFRELIRQMQRDSK